MQTLIADQLVGQIVGKQGQYRVERLLGKSRLNAVYLARNLSDQKMVALTLFITPEHFSVDAYQRFVQRFTAAAPALVALQHPHILPVHEFGEQLGYPYLITPYLTNGSLADLLRKQQRFSYEEVLTWLEQVAPAVQAAHNRGLVHGTLKPTNLVLNSEKQILVAGFGLMHMLQLSGIAQSRQPYAHLLSLAETFLAAPEYLAPEVVEGRAVDKRSDVYALGCILFELLSGTPPFKGGDPLAVAQMHVKQPLPSLQTLVPDLPVALVSVVHQALERDPQRRFQQINDVLEAFTQVVSGVTNPRQRSVGIKNDATKAGSRGKQQAEDDDSGSTTWQLMPPIVTGKIPAIPSKKPAASAPAEGIPSTGPVQAWSTPASGRRTTDLHDAVPPTYRERPATPQTAPLGSQYLEQEERYSAPQPSYAPQPPRREREPVQPPPQAYAPRQSSSRGLEDPGLAAPFANDQAWWVEEPQSQGSLQLGQGEDSMYRDDHSRQRQTRLRNAGGNPRRNTRALQKRASGPSRRQVLALAAAGGVLVAGAVVATRLPLLHQMTAGTTPNGTTANNPAPATNKSNTTAANANNPPPTQKATTPTKTTTGTTGTTGGHTGTVIGSTTLALNSSQVFMNPADGKGSVLIHLPNGNFVAYKQACTHEGVTVNYDPATHTLVCPAHGAIFNPANKGAVLQGPAVLPIPSVGIRVNTDGTVTAV